MLTVTSSGINPEEQLMADQVNAQNPGPVPTPVGFRLVVLSHPADRDGAVALMSGFLGMTAIDAKTRLRHIPAVWPETLTREAIDEAVDGLKQLGGDALAVPSDLVPDLRSAPTLHRVRCTPAGLDLISLSGTVEEQVPWDSLAAIGVARVAGLGHRPGGQLADGVFRRNLGISTVDLKPQEQGTELWIACNGPARAYRIEAEHMNYEYLGDRLSTSTGENFAQFFSDLLLCAPGVVLTESARKFHVSQGKELDSFPHSEAHRDEVLARWMAAMVSGPFTSSP